MLATLRDQIQRILIQQPNCPSIILRGVRRGRFAAEKNDICVLEDVIFACFMSMCFGLVVHMLVSMRVGILDSGVLELIALTGVGQDLRDVEVGDASANSDSNGS